MEQYVNRIKNYELLAESEIAMICDKVCDIMIMEPNLRHVDENTYVVGDIHGQFSDLVYIFEFFGSPESVSYVFLGDYIDRGENSLECIMLLLVYKILYPHNITLIRGNHEQESINKVYGFYDEIQTKYHSSGVWKTINEVFSYFNLGCVVGKRYLCVHGGISPRITKSKIERAQRFDKILDDSIINDVIWSDPYYKDRFALNPRGSGFLFGKTALKQFLVTNDFDMLIRSHQLAIEGFKFDLDGLCLTVWSAPDYMGKCSNPASVLYIEKDISISPRSLKIFLKTKRIF